MQDAPIKPIQMHRYVLAFLLVKIALAGALLIYAQYVEGEPPVSSTIITIIAVSVPIFWFIKIVNRPMLQSERMWFAVGNTVAELALTLAWFLGVFVLTDVSFSWEGFSHVVGGGGDPEAAKIGLIIGMTVGLLPVPIFSALFGWVMTKNLSKEHLTNKQS